MDSTCSNEDDQYEIITVMAKEESSQIWTSAISYRNDWKLNEEVNVDEQRRKGLLHHEQLVIVSTCTSLNGGILVGKQETSS